MRKLDFAPLYRSTVGFDHLSSLLDAVNRSDNNTQTYPPYNIELLEQDKYRITMAIAGFSKDDINIVVEDNTLSITGTKNSDADIQERKFLHKGISERNFERKFQLGDHVKVLAADLENGLLHVDLERVIPEAKKPRKIEIGGRLFDSE